jgi:hypothetical protein
MIGALRICQDVSHAISLTALPSTPQSPSHTEQTRSTQHVWIGAPLDMCGTPSPSPREPQSPSHTEACISNIAKASICLSSQRFAKQPNSASHFLIGQTFFPHLRIQFPKWLFVVRCVERATSSSRCYCCTPGTHNAQPTTHTTQHPNKHTNTTRNHNTTHNTQHATRTVVATSDPITNDSRDNEITQCDG